MKRSAAAAFFPGVFGLILLVTATANAQVPIAQEFQLPSPLAKWQPNSNWQSPSELQATAKNLVSTENKTQSIVLEVTRLEVSTDSDVALKSFFKPGSFELHSGSMPPIDLNSGFGESRASKVDDPAASTTEFATSCESVRKSMPVMLAKLDDQGVVAMQQQLGKACSKQLPTVTCYSGSPAVFNDVALQPFVVGVQPLKQANALAHQPIIQTVENGFVMLFKPTAKDGSIELEAALAHSTVSNVETFTVSGNETDGVMIQIPEQAVKRVKLATSLLDGETLFVDPRLKIEVEQKQDKKIPFAKAKEVKVEKQVYFLVKARVIVQSEEPATRLTQAR